MDRVEELELEIARLKKELAEEREKNKKTCRRNVPEDWLNALHEKYPNVYGIQFARDVRLCIFGERKKLKKMKQGGQEYEVYETFTLHCSDMTERQYSLYHEALFKILDVFSEYKAKAEQLGGAENA